MGLVQRQKHDHTTPQSLGVNLHHRVSLLVFSVKLKLKVKLNVKTSLIVFVQKQSICLSREQEKEEVEHGHENDSLLVFKNLDESTFLLK